MEHRQKLKKHFSVALNNSPSLLLISITSSTALISFGWLMGITPNSVEFITFMWKGLGELGSIATSIAAVAAVVIATKALSTWKDQFKHQELYDQLTNLENAYNDYLYSYESYKESYSWDKYRNEYGIILSEEYTQIAERVKLLQTDFNQKYTYLLRRYEQAEFTLLQHDIKIKQFVENVHLLCEQVLSSHTKIGHSIGYKRDHVTAQREYAFEVTKEINALKNKLFNS